MMHSMQCFIVGLSEPFARRLALAQVTSLQPAEEHDGDEEEYRDHRHEDAGGPAIFMPRVLLTIFILRVHVIHELQLEVY